MTNELVSRLNSPAADGIASLAGKAIIHPFLIVGEILNQLPDLLGSLVISGLHTLQVIDDRVHLTTEESGDGGFYPLCLLLWIVAELHGGHLVETPTAMGSNPIPVLRKERGL